MGKINEISLGKGKKQKCDVSILEKFKYTKIRQERKEVKEEITFHFIIC
jgi:hypothetical protein